MVHNIGLDKSYTNTVILLCTRRGLHDSMLLETEDNPMIQYIIEQGTTSPDRTLDLDLGVIAQGGVHPLSTRTEVSRSHRAAHARFATNDSLFIR